MHEVFERYYGAIINKSWISHSLGGNLDLPYYGQKDRPKCLKSKVCNVLPKMECLKDIERPSLVEIGVVRFFLENLGLPNYGINMVQNGQI